MEFAVLDSVDRDEGMCKYHVFCISLQIYKVLFPWACIVDLTVALAFDLAVSRIIIALPAAGSVCTTQKKRTFFN